MKAGTYDSKVNKNVNITGLEGVDVKVSGKTGLEE